MSRRSSGRSVPGRLIAALALALPFFTLAASPPGPPCYSDDLGFLRRHVEVVELRLGTAAALVVPAWQGRVMTSTNDHASGPSFGWLNRPVIEQGVVPPEKRRGMLQDHIHVFGGEERLWFGPEGGQFSVFFAPGSPFTFDAWHTPALFDTEPFPVTSRTESSVSLRREFQITNWSGTVFEGTIERSVRLMDAFEIARLTKATLGAGVRAVGFESVNRILHRGQSAWTPRSGLLSIWMLGMLPPTPGTVVVVPFRKGDEASLGPVVTDTYFGQVPKDRLIVGDGAVLLRCDGNHRSKIGLGPGRSLGVAGSWARESGVLTVVIYDPPAAGARYVNSLWEMQSRPFQGDALNAYNDGSPAPGQPPLGPFYEIETSSPAAELGPGGSLTHAQRTIHLTGPRPGLDAVARLLLGTSLDDIENAFR